MKKFLCLLAGAWLSVACGNSEPVQEPELGTTQQALGEMSLLTFRITSVKIGNGAFDSDMSMRLKTSWDTDLVTAQSRFFDCGSQSISKQFCDPYTNYVIPNDFSSTLHLAEKPAIYTRSKTVNLADSVTPLDVELFTEPCGGPAAFGPWCPVRFRLNIDLATGANELDSFHTTGVLSRHDQCLVLSDQWEVCYQLDVPCTKERANGKDDDCDGVIDECDAGTSILCSVAIGGACGVVPGHAQCTASGTGTCVPDTADTVQEIQNGIDDDCDGKVDECNPGQTNMTCTTPAGSACPGQPGKATCSGATPGTCINAKVDTVLEKLNGIDDDCDGLIDECAPTQTSMECAVPFAGCLTPQPGQAACSGPMKGMCVPFGVGDPTTCALPGCGLNTTGDYNNNGNPDDDGDGLSDCWEAAGAIDYVDPDGLGTAHVPLPGANPLRKNLYLEIDFMQHHKPQPLAVAAVVDAFKRSPVTNPDGTTGIDLSVTVDEELPHNDQIHVGYCFWDPLCTGVEASSIRWDHFGSPNDTRVTRYAKAWAFRYGIFAHDISSKPGTSGTAELGGDDFVVSLGSSWTSHPATGPDCPSNACVEEQAGTLMHEFGHTLGLDHGGATETNYKPNYLSVMNYSYQINNQHVKGRPLDYSRGLFPTLDEARLIESDGLGPNARGVTSKIYLPTFRVEMAVVGPLNWSQNFDVNGSPLIEVIPVQVDLNGGGLDRAMSDYDDWRHLVYNVSHSENGVAGVHSALAMETFTSTEVYASDRDGDGVSDVLDNCVLAPNPNQADRDGDNVGDACELAPSAECVDSLGNNRYRATFGYLNAKRGGVRIPPGPANRFAAGALDQGQARDFVQGRWRHAFELAFTGSSYTWLLGGHPAKATSTGLPTCQGDPDGDGIRTAEDNCPFVSNPDQRDLDQDGSGDVCASDDILGFENPQRWSTTTGTTTLGFSYDHTQGAGALSVLSANFIELTSAPMTTQQVRSRFAVTNPARVRYDLFVPNPSPNPFWVGFTQLYVSCPSAGINHQYIGQLELTGLPTGAWRTVSLALPANVLTALKSNRSDFSMQIAINAPSAVQAFALDNITFGN